MMVEDIAIEKGAGDEVLDFALLKKKKKTKRTTAKDIPAQLDPDRDYTYAELLSRIPQRRHTGGGSTTIKLPVPIINRDGKKIIIANFTSFTAILARNTYQINHLIQFIETELVTTSSRNPQGQLILNSRIAPKRLEGLFISYVNLYKKCVSCNGTDTALIKDASTHITMLRCGACTAIRSVPIIRKAFKATTRADRVH